MITCPECGGAASDKAAACPSCGYAVAEVALASRKPLRLERKSDVAGTGCAIQGLALLMPIIGAVVAGTVIPLVGAPAGFGVGLVVGIVLFIVGSSKATFYACRNCGHKVDPPKLKRCPGCRVPVYRSWIV